MGTVLSADELRVGIPSGRHCECKGSKAGGQGAWLEVSKEKSRTGEQGFSQQTPSVPSSAPPTTVRFLPGRHLPHDARHRASSDPG